MNIRTLVAALSLVAAGGAFAQEATVDPRVPTASTVTRADVRAELNRARAAGELVVNERWISDVPPTPVACAVSV